MKGEPLPNAGLAIVPEQKITQYLLSPAHPDGRGKARFFAAHGFAAANWSVLAEALRGHATAHLVADATQTPFGVRCVVDGALTCPDGRAPEVRVVWFVRPGHDAPTLVTAYPIKQRR